jgi:hypothetical protein
MSRLTAAGVSTATPAPKWLGCGRRFRSPSKSPVGSADEWFTTTPGVRAGMSRRLMKVDPHNLPEHQPGRLNHLRDLIARYHRS